LVDKKHAAARVGFLFLSLFICNELTWAANSVTVSLSSNSANFTLSAGNATNPGNTSVTATTTWSLAPPNNLDIYAYFANSTSALTDGAGHNIPSSAFFISDNAGASQALTNTLPVGGASAGLHLESIDIGPFNRNGTINDAMTFNINLGALSQLPAGTYTGTLFVQGQATGPGGAASGVQSIAISATLAEALTVNLSANAVVFTLNAGSSSNPGATTVTATTAWTLKASRTAMGLFAYFSSASAALTDGAGNNIPSSAFFISDNGGASTALTNTVGFGGANAGIQLANVAITNANETSSRTDTMSFNIDLSSGALPQIPPATYTGTLNIQARATP